NLLNWNAPSRHVSRYWVFEALRLLVWLTFGSRALILGVGLDYQPSQILLCGIRLRVGVVNYGVLLQLGQLVDGLKVAHGARLGTHDHGAGRCGVCTVG